MPANRPHFDYTPPVPNGGKLKGVVELGPRRLRFRVPGPPRPPWIPGVLGVPIESRILKGQDSLLSIVQMPAGIPVGTLAIGEAGATNAGLLAAQILALADTALALRLDAHRASQTAAIAEFPKD